MFLSVDMNTAFPAGPNTSEFFPFVPNLGTFDLRLELTPTFRFIVQRDRPHPGWPVRQPDRRQVLGGTTYSF